MFPVPLFTFWTQQITPHTRLSLSFHLQGNLTVFFYCSSPTPVKEIQLVHSLSSSEATHTMMRTQYEWLFISMTVSNKTVYMFHLKQDVMIYTVSMQCRWKVLNTVLKEWLKPRVKISPVWFKVSSPTKRKPWSKVCFAAPEILYFLFHKIKLAAVFSYSNVKSFFTVFCCTSLFNSFFNYLFIFLLYSIFLSFFSCLNRSQNKENKLFHCGNVTFSMSRLMHIMLLQTVYNYCSLAFLRCAGIRSDP